MIETALCRRLYLGLIGWTGNYLKERFYPAGIKPTHFLRYYCSHFNFAEVTSTARAIPYSATIDNWYLNTPPGFLFCPHLPLGGLTGVSGYDSVVNFIDRMNLLREKLGPIIVDLKSLGDKADPRMVKSVLLLFPKDVKFGISLDPRNPGAEKEILNSLERNRYSIVEYLKGEEMEVAERDSTFLYWHLLLDQNLDKKGASKLAESLVEHMKGLVASSEKEIFLVLKAESYQPIELLKEYLEKNLTE